MSRVIKMGGWRGWGASVCHNIVIDHNIVINHIFGLLVQGCQVRIYIYIHIYIYVQSLSIISFATQQQTAPKVSDGTPWNPFWFLDPGDQNSGTTPVPRD